MTTNAEQAFCSDASQYDVKILASGGLILNFLVGHRGGGRNFTGAAAPLPPLEPPLLSVALHLRSTGRGFQFRPLRFHVATLG